MWHADDGQLHAYLDGELASLGIEPAEMERHVAGCEECGGRLEEARRVHARASAILRDAHPASVPMELVAGLPAGGALGAATAHLPAPGPEAHDVSTAALEPRRPMFRSLPASGGRRTRAWNSRTAMVSLLSHAALITVAVYYSVAAPKESKKEEEQVTFLDIQEKQPEAPKPEPPPPPPPETPQPATPPPPKGFQELIPPKEPPPVIPDVDVSQPAVNVEDFSGVGQAGGVAKGVEGGTPQQVAAPVDSSNFAYEVAVLERAPELINKSQVASMLSRFYPRMLQDAGIGGQTVMQFVITKEGQVDAGTVKVISTSHEQFAEASTKVVERFRFRPGRYKGEAVRVLIQMPITWQPQS